MERLSTPQKWVPRSCQADVESLERGDRTGRTASRTPPGKVNLHQRTQAPAECHIPITGRPKLYQAGLAYGVETWLVGHGEEIP
jgi:hypothetical protein